MGRRSRSIGGSCARPLPRRGESKSTRRATPSSSPFRQRRGRSARPLTRSPVWRQARSGCGSGIHTGTPHVTDEGYVGVDVHRAARIAACGHGGQVLVSASTAALVGTDRLRDLGEHRLKDLSAPERIYQLGDDDFPALKSLYRTNLPVPATPFLGRENELAEVLDLLEDARLLTLTGPGGTGKTRLGLQAAAEASDRYPDGVFWVPLAPLRDPELVLETAGQALGTTDGIGRARLRQVAAAPPRQLRARRRGCRRAGRAARSLPQPAAARHQPRAAPPSGRAGVPRSSARARRWSQALSRTGARGRSRVRRDSHGAGALRSAREPPPGARAGGGTGSRPLPGAAARPPLRPARPAQGRPWCRRAPADVAGDDRVVARAARRGRAAAVRPPGRLPRRLHARGGRGGLRTPTSTCSSRSSTRAWSGTAGALLDAGDDPRVRGRAARASRRC